MTTTEENNKTVIEFDATDRKLGRLASEVSVALMGKTMADYAPNKVMPVEVVVKNVDKLSISEDKLATKVYESFSGYPGGLKRSKMEKVVSEKGYEEVLRNAVRGMLPKNKLQKPRLMNLVIEQS